MYTLGTTYSIGPVIVLSKIRSRSILLQYCLGVFVSHRLYLAALAQFLTQKLTEIATLSSPSSEQAGDPSSALHQMTTPASSSSSSASSKVSLLAKLATEASAAGQFSQAVELFSEAISLSPNNYKLYTNRANVYFEAGQIKEALCDAAHSLRLLPSPGGALIYAAVLLHLKMVSRSFKAFDFAAKHVDASPKHKQKAAKGEDKCKLLMTVSPNPVEKQQDWSSLGTFAIAHGLREQRPLIAGQKFAMLERALKEEGLEFDPFMSFSKAPTSFITTGEQPVDLDSNFEYQIGKFYLFSASELIGFTEPNKMRLSPGGSRHACKLLRSTTSFRLNIFLSHRWSNPSHPDPTGEHMLTTFHFLVATIVRGALKIDPSLLGALSQCEFVCRGSMDVQNEFDLVVVEALRPFCTSHDISPQSSESESHLNSLRSLVVSFFCGLPPAVGCIDRLVVITYAFLKEIGLFVDYTCLPQAAYRKHSPVMQAYFTASLSQLGELQQSMPTVLLWDRVCDSRAWCVAELAAGVESKQGVVFLPAEWNFSNAHHQRLERRTDGNGNPQLVLQSIQFAEHKLVDGVSARARAACQWLFGMIFATTLWLRLDTLADFASSASGDLNDLAEVVFHFAEMQCTNNPSDLRHCMRVILRNAHIGPEFIGTTRLHDLEHIEVVQPIASLDELPFFVLDPIGAFPAHFVQKLIVEVERIRTGTEPAQKRPNVGPWFGKRKERMEQLDPNHSQSLLQGFGGLTFVNASPNKSQLSPILNALAKAASFN